MEGSGTQTCKSIDSLLARGANARIHHTARRKRRCHAVHVHKSPLRKKSYALRMRLAHQSHADAHRENHVCDESSNPAISDRLVVCNHVLVRPHRCQECGRGIWLFRQLCPCPRVFRSVVPVAPWGAHFRGWVRGGPLTIGRNGIAHIAQRKNGSRTFVKPGIGNTLSVWGKQQQTNVDRESPTRTLDAHVLPQLHTRAFACYQTRLNDEASAKPHRTNVRIVTSAYFRNATRLKQREAPFSLTLGRPPTTKANNMPCQGMGTSIALPDITNS